MTLAPGTPAPDFTLPDSTGQPVTLSQFRGQKNVVLFFYPKDDSPGCTLEACGFRDRYAEFQDAGAEVIGISSDSEVSHQQFARRHNFPFLLLSDREGAVQKLYDAKALWVLPGRVTYAIDKEGIVRYVFDSMLDFAGHVAQSLRMLQALK
ncbi:MAG: peroxiredoxin [Oscillatoriales cyanobacterium SM2_1_8]|nr:peroxiredoxin [Oscillatoriales cyanobacterium SM2_1_8]